MKIRLDFVSNSSSTSFIYISSKDFNKASFFDAVGVSPDSLLLPLFKNMFEVLSHAIQHGTEVKDEAQLVLDIRYPDFTAEVIDRAKQALKAGKKVVIGHLDSDGNIEESFLCTDIFEIESSDFYINAYDNYW